jgi:AcrR family transcriptional regulator
MAPRGRPRTFDREQALRSAMDVFLARGFDGTTLEELQAAMGGIAPPSFYAAFGSKDQLFREAVTRYHASMSEHFLGRLQAPTAREGIEGLLRAGVETFAGGEGPRGCMVVLGALNCTRADTEVHAYLRELRDQGPAAIRHRLLRGIADGDVPAGAPVSELTSFFTTVMHGLAIRAHGGASRQALTDTVDAAMAAWDPMMRRPRAPRVRRMPARRTSK